MDNEILLFKVRACDFTKKCSAATVKAHVVMRLLSLLTFWLCTHLWYGAFEFGRTPFHAALYSPKALPW